MSAATFTPYPPRPSLKSFHSYSTAHPQTASASRSPKRARTTPPPVGNCMVSPQVVAGPSRHQTKSSISGSSAETIDGQIATLRSPRESTGMSGSESRGWHGRRREMSVPLVRHIDQPSGGLPLCLLLIFLAIAGALPLLAITLHTTEHAVTFLCATTPVDSPWRAESCYFTAKPFFYPSKTYLFFLEHTIWTAKAACLSINSTSTTPFIVPWKSF